MGRASTYPVFKIVDEIQVKGIRSLITFPPRTHSIIQSSSFVRLDGYSEGSQEYERYAMQLLENISPFCSL